jgi:hypothetical protein
MLKGVLAVVAAAATGAAGARGAGISAAGAGDFFWDEGAAVVMLSG